MNTSNYFWEHVAGLCILRLAPKETLAQRLNPTALFIANVFLDILSGEGPSKGENLLYRPYQHFNKTMLAVFSLVFCRKNLSRGKTKTMVQLNIALKLLRCLLCVNVFLNILSKGTLVRGNFSYIVPSSF
jgi:hypothetical protein